MAWPQGNEQVGHHGPHGDQGSYQRLGHNLFFEVLLQEHTQQQQQNRDALPDVTQWRRCHLAKSALLCRPVSERPQDQDGSGCQQSLECMVAAANSTDCPKECKNAENNSEASGMPRYSPPPCRGVPVLRTGSTWRLRFLLGVLAQDRRCAQHGWRGHAGKPHPRFALGQERRRQRRGSVAKQIGERRNRLASAQSSIPCVQTRCLSIPAGRSVLLLLQKRVVLRSGRSRRPLMLSALIPNLSKFLRTRLPCTMGLSALGLAAGLQCLDTSLRRLARNATPRVLSMKSSAPRSNATSFAGLGVVVRNTTGKFTPCRRSSGSRWNAEEIRKPPIEDDDIGLGGGLERTPAGSRHRQSCGRQIHATTAHHRRFRGSPRHLRR